MKLKGASKLFAGWTGSSGWLEITLTWGLVRFHEEEFSPLAANKPINRFCVFFTHTLQKLHCGTSIAVTLLRLSPEKIIIPKQNHKNLSVLNVSAD